MTGDGPLALLFGISLTLTTMGWWLLRLQAVRNRRARRVAAMRQGIEGLVSRRSAKDSGSPRRLVAGLGAIIIDSRLLPAKIVASMEGTLFSGGLRQRDALALFLGMKAVLVVLLPLAALPPLVACGVAPVMRPACLMVAAMTGLLLPDLVVRRMRATYLAAVRSGLPDALDMLVICTEAGLGLEFGLERVATEIAPANRSIAAELKLTSGELRILADRRAALTNLGVRTGLDSLVWLSATLIQTLQYGTPLSQALRTLAAEMRYEALMRFETQAARLPVLLTVPMVLFILPCIFIVVGGPAGLTAARTLIHH